MRPRSAPRDARAAGGGRRRRGRWAAIVVLVALAATACAADLPEADPADDGADAMAWTGDPVDLDGADLAIGSKDQPEQEILGWIAVEAARAAGASVHQEIGAGGTGVVREAQLSGLIDAYWEYTGTGWERILSRVTLRARPSSSTSTSGTGTAS